MTGIVLVVDADRLCARPGCSEPAAASLTCDYAASAVFLSVVEGERDPSRYELCARHAARFRPPYGWCLFDERAAAVPAGV